MAVVSTGFFDGVHLGHRKVIETLLEAASQRSEQSVVITFWPHPRVALQDDVRNMHLLNSLEEKKRMLYSMGVDKVEVLDFDRELSLMDTKAYLQKIVIEKYGASMIVLGYDNRIGHDMLAPEESAVCARELGLDVVICPGCRIGGKDEFVSSTKIRKSLESGNVSLASEMLGYNYSLNGVVIAGNQVGRTIGFPTANIKVDNPLKQIPAAGVYFTKIRIRGQEFYAMTNIDVNLKIESNIFKLNENIYGLEIEMEFIKFLREEVKFDDFSEMRQQLKKDYDICERLIEA